MSEAKLGDQPWHHERAFLGGSYFGGEHVVTIANQAYQNYINGNALFARKMFPSVVRYDQEVLDMVLGLLNAPDSAPGGRHPDQRGHREYSSQCEDGQGPGPGR